MRRPSVRRLDDSGSKLTSGVGFCDWEGLLRDLEDHSTV